MNRRLLLSLVSVFAVLALAPAGASAFTISSPQEGAYTNATNLDFFYADGAATTVTCSLDAATVDCGLTSATLNGVSEGVHTFTVNGSSMLMSCIVWDPMNPGTCMMMMPMPMPATSATVNFTIDRTAPVVALTSGPGEGASIRGSTASFGVSASDGELSCELDGAAVACSSSVSLSGLAVGAHRLVVSATDLAGNVGSDARNFVVAAAASPVTIKPAIVSAPKSVKNGKKIKLKVICPDGCTIYGVVKIGKKKLRLKPVTVKSGGTVVSVKLSSSARKKIKKGRKRGKKVVATFTLAGGKSPKSVRIK